MSSVNLENLSQEELNKILKEEYEKNKKLKKQNCWPTEPLKGTSSFYHFSHPVPLRGFFELIFYFLACTMFSLLGVSGQPSFNFISAFFGLRLNRHFHRELPVNIC